MNISRRVFAKVAGAGTLALAAGTSLFLVGCSVFDSILTWIPIGITAINGIVTVLGAFLPAGGAIIIGLVKAAFADLAATITEYKSDTNPADKATLLAKIKTILGDIVTNFQAFLNQLNIGGNPIEAVVIGLATGVLDALMGFFGQLPPAPAAGKALSSTFRVGPNGRLVTIVPTIYKDVNAFKSAYNGVADSNGHPELDIH